MTAMSPLPQHTAAEFFALRTPLLPFEAFVQWSAELEACTALADPTRLEQALARDRRRLRDRLYAIARRPEVREALFVASPDLDECLTTWLHEPDSKPGQRIELTLVRYFARMAGRATPFGLFAGAAVGTVGAHTHLVTSGYAEYQRHTRLDMDYLFALTSALQHDAALVPLLTYYPNTSLYQAAGRVRYVEARLDGKQRSYHLVAVEPSPYLDATLARACTGADARDLAAALVDEDISLAEASSYVAALIDSQILVADLALAVTGPEPLQPLIARLSAYRETQAVATQLTQVRDALAALDADGLGLEPARYRALADLPAKPSLPRLFQVDLLKPATQATLGQDVLHEIAQGVRWLHGLARPQGQNALTRFADSFRARYEDAEVPLVEALDDEIGIGFPPAAAGGPDGSPLLRGLAFPTVSESPMAWSARDEYLLHKLSTALARDEVEITLDEHDLEALSSQQPPPLPDAFAVMATVAATSDEALAAGHFRVVLEGASGPSGARLLGRFCHADPTLRRGVEKHLRAEEALRLEAVFAEVVHLPEGRVGNILLRPVLRAYEIPFLGRASTTAERHILLTDLLVSIRFGRVVLRSARLGCEVIPRLTTAHNYAWNSLGVYQFLCALQDQAVANVLYWHWGALHNAPFLPRVVMERLVLARAQWRLSQAEIRRLSAAQGSARFHAVQQWRQERRLPRFIALTDGDNQLPVDLDNVLSIEACLQILKGRDAARFTELLPGPEALCAHAPEGRFTHELIVPFVRQPGDNERRQVRTRASSVPAPRSPRRFAPGSEWLYVKLYTGSATADHVLREVVAPLTRQIQCAGAADQWFFIRYADPDWHLRVRFHGQPQRLHDDVWPLLQETAAPLLADGRIRRVQLDTYEREVERYGGAAGILLAERLFHIDSEAVLELLTTLAPGDSGLDERWRLTLGGMNMLLTDFGFDLNAKHALLQQLRQAYAQEFRAEQAFLSQVGERFRQERRDLEALLNPAPAPEHPLAAGLAVLRRRSGRLALIVADLQAGVRAHRILVPLAELVPGYLHMYANRLLRSAQRAQEMILYDYLARLYESQMARGSTARRDLGD